MATLVRSRLLVPALCTLLAVLLWLPPALGFASGQTADDTERLSIVASGLANPRDLAWDANDALYVAQSGTGDTRTSVDAAAAVVKIVDGCPVAHASGLPSSEDPFRDVLGPSGVAFLDGTLYVLQAATGLYKDLDPSRPNGIYAVQPNGELRLVADLTAWIRDNPVAQTPGDANELGEPFRILADDAGFWVLESNRGEVLRVTKDGEVTRVADLSAGHPVLTGFALAPEGGVYVGNLTAAPHDDGTAKVVYVTEAGEVSDVWTNLTTVVGIALDDEGTMYALEMATGNENGMRPATGKLVRQTGLATAEDVLTGLDYPIALRRGPDDALYLAFPAYGDNNLAGAVVRFEPGGAEPVAMDAELAAKAHCPGATPYVAVTPGPAGSPVVPPGQDHGSAEPGSNEIAIEIKDFAFLPDNITVAVGTTITWTNRDPVAHTATATDNPGTFSSGNIAPGDSFSSTFDKPGTIPYVCVYHPNMRATVTVE